MERAERAGRPLEFRDRERGEALALRLRRVTAELGRAPISLMHVCGSHEQAIARFGLRHVFPEALEVIMGPGCPVCITDMPEVDEAVALARGGVCVATYGDMLRVPGTTASLADVQAEGARVEVVYGVHQAVELARRSDDPVVFFATGFETTAVATAAALLAGPPRNFYVLSAHKYVPPAMEVVASLPDSRIEGFLAAGHAATITGWGIFESFVERYGLPTVVAGFEPLDILAGLVRLVELVRDGRAEVVNAFPRCVSKEGNQRALEAMWKVFELRGGHWRGIALVPDGNLQLREQWEQHDARKQLSIDLSSGSLARHGGSSELTSQCVCGQIMSGRASPLDCALFGRECQPHAPVGACMVSSEGTCRIWHQYGGHPSLEVSP